MRTESSGRNWYCVGLLTVWNSYFLLCDRRMRKLIPSLFFNLFKIKVMLGQMKIFVCGLFNECTDE